MSTPKKPAKSNEDAQVALQNLIEEVRASTMTEPAKQQTVDALEELLQALHTTCAWIAEVRLRAPTEIFLWQIVGMKTKSAPGAVV